MSAPRIILASLPSSCQKLSNWWKFDEVLTKTILHSFLRHGVYPVMQCHVKCQSSRRQLLLWCLLCRQSCESKQKSSSRLALPEALHGCDSLSVCCSTVLTYCYNKLRAWAFLSSSSHRSRNCGRVTLAMIIKSSRSL